MASDSNSIQLIWFRFEVLRGLVQQIDKLFGSIIICNHGMYFYTLCCFVYYSLILINNLEDTLKSGADALPWQMIFVFLIVVFTIRLFFGVRMISNVHKYSDKLLTTVSNLWVSQWNYQRTKSRHQSVPFPPSICPAFRLSRWSLCPDSIRSVNSFESDPLLHYHSSSIILNVSFYAEYTARFKNIIL